MFDTAPQLRCGHFTVKLDRTRVMGIVNVTPDSFSDGGQYNTVDAAIAHAIELAEQGAAILDIGGESTRPNATPVTLEDELARVIPVIDGLRTRVDIPISIDTFKPEVMQAAVKAGASMINDVYALRQPGALDAAAELKVPVVIMHSLGAPHAMDPNPEYDDVVGEVHRFLAERIFACEMAGIDKQHIVVDPGFGFGKTLQHNLQLLAGLRRFTELGVPVLAGLSRKRSIGELTDRTVPAERIHGSVAAHLIAASNGARIVRVHDVGPTVDALKVLEAVRAIPTPRDGKRPAPEIVWPED